MSTVESEHSPIPDIELNAPAPAAQPVTVSLTTTLERTTASGTLEKLLAEVADDDLRAKLMEAYARAKPKKFGLVYEDHEPDSITLPAGTPLRRGDLVRHEVAGKAGQQMFQVVSTGQLGLRIAPVARAQDVAKPEDSVLVTDASDLRVVKAWGAPVYPGLTRIGEPVGECAPAAPEHMLIQGENLHALQALKYTHAGALDLILTDPPYNTGNKSWIYNDAYVAEKDAFRHSKWLAFMEHRLTIARDLLKDTGVIVVAIGDDEHHRLRMLMDEVFGAENFISDIVWQGGRKNDSRFVSNGTDYMLVYGKSVEALVASSTLWREEKPGVPEMLEAGKKAWIESGHDAEKATKALRAWLSALPKDHPAKGSGNYNYDTIDESGRVVYLTDLSSASGATRKYDIVDPRDGSIVQAPGRGWGFTQANMNALISEGRIHFYENNYRQPRYKRFLDETNSWVPESVFYQDRRGSNRHLESLLGEKRFPFPKDHTALARWIRLMAPLDAVILDFFGGSGSTMEAVIRLNAEDGGTRQAILVTNNELAAGDDVKMRKAGYVPGDDQYEALGVCRHVSIPRLTSVITGKRPDGTEHKHGAVAGARFSAWKLDYLDPVSVEMGIQFTAIAPMLWASSGCRGEVILDEPLEEAATDHYGILVSMSGLDRFAEKAVERAAEGPFTAWIVADTDAQWAAAADRLPADVKVRRLWRDYVRNFEINVAGR